MPGAWEQPEKSQYDLVIGAPTTGTVSLDWASNLRGLQTGGLRTYFSSWRGLPFDVARNRIVRDAQEVGARYLLFLDTDVLPPTDGLLSLLAYRLPIISGLVYSKRGYPALLLRVGEQYTPLPARRIPRSALVQVDAVPMGFCLLDMRVFDVIPFPWFKWTIEDPTSGSGLSEDYWFCRQAQEHNFRIFAHTGVRCLHETLEARDPMGVAEKGG